MSSWRRPPPGSCWRPIGCCSIRPRQADGRTRLLLQDLELVLAEIAQLSPRPSSPDLDLITEGLEHGGVMSRLRTAVPSGTSPTQGVL